MIKHRHLLTGWILLLLYVSVTSSRLNFFKKKSVPQEGDVRLFGSGSGSEGRVEVYHDGRWGTVCDDDWDTAEAQVVCRQLNFPGAKSVVFGKDYGPAPGPIWLDDINCNGTEKRLPSCGFKDWGVTDCSHKEDVGVICETGSNNMTISNSPHHLDHSIGLSDFFGEIFDNGTSCDFMITFQSPNGNIQEDGTTEMISTTICAHKLILMQVPSFQPSVGSNDITVTVNMPCQPYFTSFIRYLYTHKIDVTFSSALCIHQLASHFGVKQLMEDTGRLFSKVLPDDPSFNTQVSLYQYAVETEDLVLGEICVQYLAWNFQNLTTSPSWSNLPVDLLQALLTRSDLVVPDEYFLLQTLESWITAKASSVSFETQTDLLRLIRFPMIPAEKLYNLESQSLLYATHKNMYLDSILKAYQFNVVLFSNFSVNPDFNKENVDYKPRIYTAETWSVAVSPSDKSRYQNQYGPYRYQYDRYGYGYYPTPSPYVQRTFRTPFHSSLLFKDKMISWDTNVFKDQRDCSRYGLRCESVPAAKMTRQNQYTSESNVLFRNRLLLMCQDKYVCQVQDFKGSMAYISTNDTQVHPYPCPDDRYTYIFVVRPEYI